MEVSGDLCGEFVEKEIEVSSGSLGVEPNAKSDREMLVIQLPTMESFFPTVLKNKPRLIVDALNLLADFVQSAITHLVKIVLGVALIVTLPLVRVVQKTFIPKREEEFVVVGLVMGKRKYSDLFIVCFHPLLR